MFIMKKETCPPVIFNDHQLPQADEAKYLGLLTPDLAETHLVKKITVRSKTQTNVLDPRP
jgi:hypothetical protein